MTRMAYQPSYSGREVSKIFLLADKLGYHLVRERPIDYSKMDICPVGDVPFCEAVMVQQGVTIQRPDFYPPWLSGWLRRAVMYVEDGEYRNMSKRGWFVKRTDSYKSEPARVIPPGGFLPTGSWAISGLVNFVQEWRYYISNAKEVANGWYAGNDEDETAPHLGIEWPDGFCGAADFGRLDDGTIALVEVHHPYACGWYGEDHKAYLLWLIDGFEYMKRGL